MTIGDESQYRKPGFTEGHNVMLGDGQAWSLRNPVVYYQRARTPCGWQLAAEIGDDRSFGELLRQYDAAETFDDVMTLGFKVAEALLVANYDLSEEQLDELLKLEWRKGCDHSDAQKRTMEIIEVANGRGPNLPKRTIGTRSPAPMEQG